MSALFVIGIVVAVVIILIAIVWAATSAQPTPSLPPTTATTSITAPITKSITKSHKGSTPKARVIAGPHINGSTPKARVITGPQISHVPQATTHPASTGPPRKGPSSKVSIIAVIDEGQGICTLCGKYNCPKHK
jgi:hypothetical protein